MTALTPEPFKVFTVSSYRNLHAVRLFQRELLLMVPHVEILDWTHIAPKPTIPVKERKLRMIVGQDCLVPEKCEKFCHAADLVVYYGDSGKDTALQVGMARAIGTPVLGIPGPLEEVGLILQNAVSAWVDNPQEAIDLIASVTNCHQGGDPRWALCQMCHAERVCHLAGKKI